MSRASELLKMTESELSDSGLLKGSLSSKYGFSLEFGVSKNGESTSLEFRVGGGKGRLRFHLDQDLTPGQRDDLSLKIAKSVKPAFDHFESELGKVFSSNGFIAW